MKINNFVIDHVLRGIMTSTADGSALWSINQVTDPSLSVTSETAEAVDALGTTIATFNRGKAAEFTANNSIFDLGLFAAQNGVEVEDASSAAPIIAPMFEEIEVISGTTEYELSKTVADADDLNTIYVLNGDGTLGTALKKDTTAGVGKFVYDAVGNTITINNSITSGRLFVMYEYAAEAATSMTADAINFPKAGKFVLEVLGIDVCDPTTQIHAYLVFPNAKLDANVDISFTTDGNHPFTIQCQQDYCDPEKKLFQLIIPDEA